MKQNQNEGVMLWLSGDEASRLEIVMIMASVSHKNAAKVNGELSTETNEDGTPTFPNTKSNSEWHKEVEGFCLDLKERIAKAARACRAICPNCGAETQGIVYTDEMGDHMICQKCSGSFNI